MLDPQIQARLQELSPEERRKGIADITALRDEMAQKINAISARYDDRIRRVIEDRWSRIQSVLEGVFPDEVVRQLIASAKAEIHARVEALEADKQRDTRLYRDPVELLEEVLAVLSS